MSSAFRSRMRKTFDSPVAWGETPEGIGTIKSPEEVLECEGPTAVDMPLGRKEKRSAEE